MIALSLYAVDPEPMQERLGKDNCCANRYTSDFQILHIFYIFYIFVHILVFIISMLQLLLGKASIYFLHPEKADMNFVIRQCTVFETV